jgi:hypothetical protein
MLVFSRLLERLKLTARQRGRHIAVLPPDDPIVNHLLVTLEKNEADSVAAADRDPAVSALKI